MTILTKYVVLIWLVVANLTVNTVYSVAFQFPTSVPEIYKAFGIYKDNAGALVTPFGRWVPEGVKPAFTNGPQCPCVDRGKAAPDCRPYDPTYQAVTLEEALMNFKDTTADPQAAKTIVPRKNVKAGRFGVGDLFASQSHPTVCAGNDAVCRACTKYTLMNMLNQLASQPYTKMNEKLKDEITKTLNDNGLNTPSVVPSCPGLKSLVEDHPPVASAKGAVDINRCIANASTPTWTRRLSANRRNPAGAQGNVARYAWQRRQGSAARATPGMPSEIKEVFEIKCQERGTAVSEGSTYVGLCKLCWKWGVLDSKYNPPYVNMMVCDDDDKRCLSGWGTCKQRNRNLEVLKNVGTESLPKYEKVSINVPMMCDCQVQAGSALHNFIRN